MAYVESAITYNPGLTEKLYYLEVVLGPKLQNLILL